MRELDLGKLFAGDRRTLSRAITLIESGREADRDRSRELLEAALPRSGCSLRIAITGPPGVGKSTFIDALGTSLARAGRRVAVLAVDPSSPRGGGSILGDKTRMERLSREPNAYIRPTPASGSLGGVARRTREAMLLCEAAGFELVFVETLGVGQAEVEVAGMVDFFVVLVLPNAGDELQGIKRGIVEFANLIVVNKAEGEACAAAELARSQYQSAVRLLMRDSAWEPRVLTCSAREHRNIETVWRLAEEFRSLAQASGEFASRRKEQNSAWFHKLLAELLERRMREKVAVREVLPQLERRVAAGEITPYSAIHSIERLF